MSTPTFNIKEYIQDLVDSGVPKDEAVALAKEELKKRKVTGIASGRRHSHKAEERQYIGNVLPMHLIRQRGAK